MSLSRFATRQGLHTPARDCWLMENSVYEELRCFCRRHAARRLRWQQSKISPLTSMYHCSSGPAPASPSRSSTSPAARSANGLFRPLCATSGQCRRRFRPGKDGPLKSAVLETRRGRLRRAFRLAREDRGRCRVRRAASEAHGKDHCSSWSYKKTIQSTQKKSTRQHY